MYFFFWNCVLHLYKTRYFTNNWRNSLRLVAKLSELILSFILH